MSCMIRRAESPVSLSPERHPIDVARDLLGTALVCRGTAAVLVEVEAYHEEEPACHGYGRRPTARTEDLFGEAGTLYVYFTYGMHWCANLVTSERGVAAAVLFRAGIPVHGEALMRERRARTRAAPDPAALLVRELCAGPARLVQALDIRAADRRTRLLDHTATTLTEALVLADFGPVLVHDVELARSVGLELPLTDNNVTDSPRIGISAAVDLPWRLTAGDGTYLSRPAPRRA